MGMSFSFPQDGRLPNAFFVILNGELTWILNDCRYKYIAAHARTRIVSKPSHLDTKLHTKSTFLAFYLSYFFSHAVRFSPLGTAATVRPIVPVPDDRDCGAIGGMKIGRGNRSTQRKPTPVPLYRAQILHDLTRARTKAAAMGSRRLTA
jgi:hypothetical protein